MQQSDRVHLRQLPRRLGSCRDPVVFTQASLCYKAPGSRLCRLGSEWVLSDDVLIINMPGFYSEQENDSFQVRGLNPSIEAKTRHHLRTL